MTEVLPETIFELSPSEMALQMRRRNVGNWLSVKYGGFATPGDAVQGFRDFAHVVSNNKITDRGQFPWIGTPWIVGSKPEPIDSVDGVQLFEADAVQFRVVFDPDEGDYMAFSATDQLVMVGEEPNGGRLVPTFIESSMSGKLRPLTTKLSELTLDTSPNKGDEPVFAHKRFFTSQELGRTLAGLVYCATNPELNPSLAAEARKFVLSETHIAKKPQQGYNRQAIN